MVSVMGKMNEKKKKQYLEKKAKKKNINKC